MVKPAAQSRSSLWCWEQIKLGRFAYACRVVLRKRQLLLGLRQSHTDRTVSAREQPRLIALQPTAVSGGTRRRIDVIGHSCRVHKWLQARRHRCRAGVSDTQSPSLHQARGPRTNRWHRTRLIGHHDTGRSCVLSSIAARRAGRWLIRVSTHSHIERPCVQVPRFGRWKKKEKCS